MKRRIYTDTSVIGGCLDKEFADFSTRLFKCFALGSDILVLSDLTRLELERAAEAVRAVVDQLPQAAIEEVRLTPEARELAEQYLSARVIGPGSLLDAQHIATATINRVDLLVSWNFKHIVNVNRIHGYNSVNLRLGYPQLEIRSPQEVVSDEE
ncbi:MAG TPA: PIN domain-containing protein [Thermoanaerobaculia bacterium]|nr:PIN domain-containing protein [Thermoanaerobaculia bacterium]